MIKGCYIIAEAGVNHNGSLETAFKLVDAACETGADAIKFQTFKAERLVTSSTEMAGYQKKNTGNEQSQFDMLKALELTIDDFAKLNAYCAQKNIDFLSTAFDCQSLDELLSIASLPYLKISSGDLVDAPLLLHSARKKIPLILSCGMATLLEIEEALSIIAYAFLENAKSEPGRSAFKKAWQDETARSLVHQNVTVLQCTTAYPASMESVNLKTMQSIAHQFGVRVGFSDHTNGIECALAASALGAGVIEKHITLSKNMPGPDHLASTEPDEFREMVRGIRNIETALGKDIKTTSVEEQANRLVARKSLIAVAPIAKGARITEQDIQVLRPGTGTPALYYWDVIGTPAQHDYMPGDPLKETVS